MTAVFGQAVMVADERGRWVVMAVYLRELREMPLNLARKHWHSLTKNELPMTMTFLQQMAVLPALLIALAGSLMLRG